MWMTTVLHLAFMWLISTALWPINGLCQRLVQPPTVTPGRLPGAGEWLPVAASGGIPLWKQHTSGVTLGVKVNADMKEKRLQGRDTQQAEEKRQPATSTCYLTMEQEGWTLYADQVRPGLSTNQFVLCYRDVALCRCGLSDGWILHHLLRQGYSPNMEVDRRWAVHGCKQTVGYQLHSEGDQELQTLQIKDRVF